MKLCVLVLCLLASGVSAFVAPRWQVVRDAPSSRDLTAKENLRTVKKRDAGRDERENTLQKIKRDGNVRLSFKECNLDPGMREDCGYFGMSEVDCYRRGCCWGETETEGVPWCYHSIPTQIPQCAVDSDERNGCGSYDVTKEECMAQMCCWKPSRAANVPWCFHYKREPVFEGECGLPPIPPLVSLLDSRIVGGTETREHSWPWMVSLQVDDFHFCGGSLISDQWVVTAAHCERGFYHGNESYVVVGMHSHEEEAEFQRTVNVDRIIPYSGYDSRTIDKDIMLLKLSEKIEFGETIQPVCLPGQGERVPVGTRCFTTGWGTLEYGGDSPEVLQQVMTPILEVSTCNQENWYNGSITDNMMCAGYQQGGRSACHGDSGGPLACYMEDHWVLYGIVSWGHICGWEENPGIYARYSNFATWVEQTIANDQ